MKKQKSKKSKEQLHRETIIADCGVEGLLNHDRQREQDLVDTTLNMDRRQLPDFLNIKVGWNVLIGDDEGNTRVKTLPPMSYDDMIAHIKEEYAGCHIIEWRDLR